MSALFDNRLTTNDVTETARASARTAYRRAIVDHGLRCARTAYALARLMGLDHDSGVQIGGAAATHDVGKLVIDIDVLEAARPLSVAERLILNNHCAAGALTLHRFGELHGLNFNLHALVAMHHHERWDGAGYPRKLSGTAIPLAARIVAVCDAFDALTSLRAYQPAVPSTEALERLKKDSGTHFDPAAIHALEALVGAGSLADDLLSFGLPACDEWTQALERVFHFAFGSTMRPFTRLLEAA